MADVTFQELMDELDLVKTGVAKAKADNAELKTLNTELQEQLAGGSPITREQLTALDEKIDSINADLTVEASRGKRR